MKSVVIVGAGVIGLFCALRLAKAGARVTLLEAEPDDLDVFRPGASTAAAGMLAPFNESGSAHDALALRSLDLWREASPGSPWEDGVRFDGGVVISESAEDAAALQARVMSFGRGVAPLSPSQARSRTGLKAKVEHALFIADEGVVDPLWAMSGLALEARKHGVVIKYNQDVAKVTPHSATTHEDAVHEADFVLLAPGVWATDALTAAAPALKRVRPAKGHLLSVKLAKPLKPNVRAPDFYLAQRREDAVLGATLEFDRYDRAVDVAQTQKLLSAAAELFPGEVTPFGQAWTGIRPMSPDGWPMIGPTGAGVLVAAGHSRNGWLLAPITAEIVTAYVFGAEIPDAWAALSPQRFETP